MKDRQDRWVNDLLARYYPYEYKKGEWGQLQLSVRPIQLYEIVFPEKMEQEVLGLIRPVKYDRGNMRNLFDETMLATMRKILGADKKIGKIPPEEPRYLMNRNDIEVIGIGLKKDVFENGVEKI